MAKEWKPKAKDYKKRVKQQDGVALRTEVVRLIRKLLQKFRQKIGKRAWGRKKKLEVQYHLLS